MPFLPQPGQVAEGYVAFSVGLMPLLLVVTVIYLPVTLPILLPGASVSPWDIAQSLICTMLLPLGIGLFIKARYEEAASPQPHIPRASCPAIVLMPVTILSLQFSTIIGTIGTGGILAALLSLVSALLAGLLRETESPGCIPTRSGPEPGEPTSPENSCPLYKSFTAPPLSREPRCGW